MKSAITSSHDDPQPIYEDLDASMLAVTDGGQSEVKVKPVPRPRSKLPPKTKCNTTDNNTVETVDKTSDTTDAVDSHIYECIEDYKRLQPVDPPPRPPGCRYVTSFKPTAGVNGGNHYSPAVSTESKQSPQKPRRPPLPAIYCDTPPSTMRPTSEHTDRTDRPAVPPRLLHSTSQCESSPPQAQPPLPPCRPPPSSSVGPSESVYNETEYRPYLVILPENNEDIVTKARSTLRSGQHEQSGCCPSHPQTTPDTEDIYGMLRWLKRVSKSDFMAPSLYGLTIEEEISLFNQRAMNVRKALRLFNLLMMKRNESLRDLITQFRSISSSLDKMQKKNKTMGIAGGTTGAVGGVTAVLGIALAPVTMGASLIATAVGAGMVASAGGMGAHAAKKADQKTVTRMKVEKLVNDYKAGVADLEHCLDFILCGMNELQRHDIARLQRAGVQADALKMAQLSQSVIGNYIKHDRKTPVAHTSGMSSERLLQGFAKEIDQYFSEKNDQKLKKSSKSRFSGRVHLLAEDLQNELDHLNKLWEKFS
uniref:uncharacterized protein LOC124072731 n=1 Tax=Scatophagus argus TaxID=75038 RepID=UPI001ED85527|nr:uncharacterized protein LOC124072731 [Scatophagus argus]